MVCVTECDLESSIVRRPWPTGEGGGCCAVVKKNNKRVGASVSQVLFGDNMKFNDEHNFLT